MQEKKMSIVVTCYNKCDHIGAMLDSIISQVWDDIEVIVVDDGSTDGSKAVIDAYVPKIKQRGYDVVVISQTNAGVSGAVKSGLQQVSGNFVCVVDGDDILQDEYASALATLLIENPQFDWVVSDFADIPYVLGNSRYLKSEMNFDINQYPMERWLDARTLKCVSDSFVLIAVRYSFLQKNRIIENIITVPRYDFEPQFTLALMAASGSAFHLKRGLYRYSYYVPGSINDSYRQSESSIYNFVDLYEAAMKETLVTYGALTPMRKKFIAVYRLNLLFFRDPQIKESVLVSKLLALDLLQEASVDYDIAQKAGFMTLHYYITRQILSIDLSKLDIKPKYGGKIIAYGAFGKAATQIRTGLHNSDVRPDEYWDCAVKPEDDISGVPVLLPDFSRLEENDVLFILIKTTTTSKEIITLKESKTTKGHVFFFYDVLEYLCRYYFVREKSLL